MTGRQNDRRARWGELAKKYLPAIDQALDNFDVSTVKKQDNYKLKFVIDLPVVEGVEDGPLPHDLKTEILTAYDDEEGDGEEYFKFVPGPTAQSKERLVFALGAEVSDDEDEEEGDKEPLSK